MSFASYDPDAILRELIAGYEAAADRTLAQGDPIRLFLNAIAAAIIQERFLLDDSARNSLLMYARGDYLDALGDLVGVTRLAAVASRCTVLFTLSAAPGTGNSVTIPAGTRIAKAGAQVYFETSAELVISDLATTGSVSAACLTVGASGNGYAVGEISTMVDLVAGVVSAANTTESAGGSDIEGDEGLRARIRLAPTAFSCAGPRDAYEFWARTASALIADVSVVSPDPGKVDVYVLLADGELPDSTMLDAVEAVLNVKTVRPLTDFVTAKAPVATNFTIDVDYYVLSDSAAQATEIRAAVEAAVEAYLSWQISAIGRDVNPSKLVQMMVDAGAKRVAVTAPVYAAVDETHVAALSGEATVTYGGLEDE